jgi:hypothetical protein
MRLKLLLSLTAVFIFSLLNAADLKNMDTVDYSIRVVTEDKSEEIVIKAGTTISGICTECTLYLDGSEEPFDVYEGDVIIIKDGVLDFSSDD